MAPSIIVFFFLLVPLWAFLAKRNDYTRDVLYNGWSPVIAAMVISRSDDISFSRLKYLIFRITAWIREFHTILAILMIKAIEAN